MFEKFIEEIRHAKTNEALNIFAEEIEEIQLKVSDIETDEVRINMEKSVTKMKKMHKNRLYVLDIILETSNAKKCRKSAVEKLHRLLDCNYSELDDTLSFIDINIATSKFKFTKEYKIKICTILEKVYESKLCADRENLAFYLDALYYEFEGAVNSKYNYNIIDLDYDEFDDVIVNDDNSISFK